MELQNYVKDFLEPLVDPKYIKLHDSSDLLTIIEEESKPTIREITINGLPLLEISVKLLGEDVYSKIFKKPSPTETNFRIICDGAFLTNFDDKWFVCVVELKNSLNSKTVGKALKQLESTAIKAKYFLDLFGGIEPLEIFTVGFIVSQIPNKSTEDKIITSKAIATGRLYDKMCSKLEEKKKIILPRKDCFSNNFQINERYRTNDMPIFLIEGNGNTIELSDYL